MQKFQHRLRRASGVVALAAAFACASPADAARVAVLSNAYFSETASDFSARIAGHTFTAIDVSTSVPALSTLTADFDLILLFEDRPFVNSTAVGNRVAAFAQTGRPVILGTFYDQDRSDGSPSLAPHGWGGLESVDPNTTDGTGTPYAERTLNPASIVAHPLTTGITALTSRRFAGGNQAKPGSVVLATWRESNARGLPDPAIAYRVSGPSCIIHIGIAPQYPTVGIAGTDFSGDFYATWKNAFDFGAGGCVTSTVGGDPLAIPALSGGAMAVTVLLLAALGGLVLRRQRQRSA